MPQSSDQTLTETQIKHLTQKTPKQFIKKRPGPGGMQLDYVEVGFIINVLNNAFAYDWEFKIAQEQIGKKQVWVRGELIVRLGDHTITKSQYGGSDIRLNRTGTPVSIADDLKTAASDSLKKCASLLGVASDVYWKDLDNLPSENLPTQTKSRSEESNNQEFPRYL